MSARKPSARIAIIGAGGTGCALLPLLALLPDVSLLLIDGDTVEATNPARQPLYGPADIGRLKVQVAGERLQASRPALELVREPRFLDASNAAALLHGCDLVVDCTDDLHARLLIDRVCAAQRIPLVTGAVHGRQVQVATLHVPGGNDAAPAGLHHLFPHRPGADQDGCDMRQVPAHVTTLAAAVMARHVEALLQGDHSLAGMLELIDTGSGRWLRIAAPAAPQDEELIAERPRPTDHA